MLRTVQISALRKLEYDDEGRPVQADGYDEHAAAVRLRLTQPQITQIWADCGYAGDLVDWARDRLWLTPRIVSRPKGVKGFVVLPRRWKVERTIGWCMNRPPQRTRLRTSAPDSEAHLNWAVITTMTRRLTRKSPRTDTWSRKPRATQG
ncbi:transposase [Streptomyces olivaceoviridis]